jgi:predicted ATPase
LVALDAAPTTATEREQRLDLMALLGPALIGLHGPGAKETQEHYVDAVDLVHNSPAWEKHFPIFWGWWRLSHLRDFKESRERAKWLYDQVKRRSDLGLLLQAHHCNWAALHNQGDLVESAWHVSAGLALYCPEEHSGHASLYGNHDAKVCGHAHLALGLWQRGLTIEAEAEEEKAIAWAERLGHIGSMLHALEFALIHRAYRRDPTEVRTIADRLSGMAEEFGYGHYVTRCQIFQGWAMAVMGDAKRGAALAAEALSAERGVNTADDFAVFHCLVAESWIAAGEKDRALADLLTAQTDFERIGLCHWLPEVWRMIGDLMRALDPTNVVGAAKAYVKAYRLAQRQGAHRLALRATKGMAAIASSANQRRRADARIGMARRCVLELGGDEDEHYDIRMVQRESGITTEQRVS